MVASEWVVRYPLARAFAAWINELMPSTRPFESRESKALSSPWRCRCGVAARRLKAARRERRAQLYQFENSASACSRLSAWRNRSRSASFSRQARAVFRRRRVRPWAWMIWRLVQ